ncbi:MAG: hypothetical protein VR64_18120 [Desulfatitalea sp. BRH_c12]|nr:MAG: hypothetical protein VR64_18120 [Desulfatitalea sp. BRH_c12]
MILLTIHMKVAPEKRQELTQAMVSLMISIRRRKGCLHCKFYYSAEDPNELCLFERWGSRQALTEHLRSEHFKVLLGAMSLLMEPHETRFFIEAPHFTIPGTENLCWMEMRQD